MESRPRETDTESAKGNPVIGGALRSLFFLALLVVLIFLCAGRWDYWQGWLLVGTIALQNVVSILQFSKDESLAAERLKPGPGVKWWDRFFVVLYFPLATALLIVGALDAGRFGWTGRLPTWVYSASFFVYLASFAFTRWAISTNRWFSSFVRIQVDRDQQVVRDGPYRLVRHPGYAGIIGSFVAAPFVLGSLWALVPAGAVVWLLVARTLLEDATLKRELFGYIDYADRVKYRLVPGVW
jgi:protein-S-isoprenylcysteine O-methyltransferase Ste14